VANQGSEQVLYERVWPRLSYEQGNQPANEAKIAAAATEA
jgi:hypothetical protein